MNNTSKYQINFFGYTGGPEFNSLKEARKTLNQSFKADKVNCKQKFGAAFGHKTPDSYSITLASDPRSALWSAASIQAL